MVTSATEGPRAATAAQGSSLAMLKHRLRGLLEVLPPDRPLVYLDYPVHLNFGDLLIMRGTERFWVDHGHRVLARSAHMNFLDRVVTRMNKQTILVLHGGGNFGDLYPVHQGFREQIVRRFPDNRIVVLPQSVYFSSAAQLERSAQVFKQHRDLILCVRDRESLARVHGRFTQQTLLLPDMAHQLWDENEGARNDTGRTLNLLRTDIETSARQLLAPVGSQTRDWLDFHPRWSCRIFGRILWLHRLEGKTGCELGAQALWYSYCAMLHRHMESRFAEYGEVVTSRLHGMIFALLLGKQVRYLDNLYGKLGGYARTWFDETVPAAPYPAAG